MIRPFGLRDVFAIRRLTPRGVGFDLRCLLLHSPSPAHCALLGYLTRHHLGTITCIHERSKELETEGIIQVWPCADQAEWDLAFLAPSLDHHRDAPDVWLRMLTHLIVLAARRDVERVCARSSEDAEAEDLLRKAGFTVVEREEVFVLSHQPAPAPSPKGLRQLDRRDREALDELYSQVRPPLVQQAEGLQRHWSTPPHLTSLGLVAASEHVWAERGRIIAYLGLCSSSRGHWLEVVVRPERRADVLPYAKHVLTLARCTARTPVYCPVPDHDVGLGWLLRTLGFESYSRQVLLVAHTVARVPVGRRITISGLERSVDMGASPGHMIKRSALEGADVECLEVAARRYVT